MRRAAILAAAFAAMTAGCGPRRAPVPLTSPEDNVVARPLPSPAAAEKEEVEATTITEEPLPEPGVAETATETARQPGQPGNPSGTAGWVGTPSPLDTIGPATPPNVAAATRLVEAGRVRMSAGDYGAALEQLERAIAIDPVNPYAYYYLAELHFRHRTYDQAIAFADRAASLSGSRSPVWSSRAYTLQGNAYEAVGRFADARSAYKRALQVAPGNLAAQVGLVRLGAGAPAPQ